MFISSFFAYLSSVIIRKDVDGICLVDTSSSLVLSEGRSLRVRQKQEGTQGPLDSQSHEGHVPVCLSPQLHFPTAFDIRRHSLRYLQQDLPVFIKWKRKQMVPKPTVDTLLLRVPRKVVELQPQSN